MDPSHLPQRRYSDSAPEVTHFQRGSPIYSDLPEPQYHPGVSGNRPANGHHANIPPAWTELKPSTTQYVSPVENQRNLDKTRRRICGLSPLALAIIALVALLIIVGGVVGGVVGTRSVSNKNGSNPNPTTSQSSASATTSSPSSASTGTSPSSTASGSLRPTSPARYVGIAASSYANSNLRVFYLDKQNGGFFGHTFRNNNWEDHGMLSGLNNPPSMSNAIALAYWNNSNGAGTHLYYISQQNSIVELSLTCNVNAPCSINSQTILPPTDISTTSNVAVVQYYNQIGQYRAWVYYINKQNQVARTLYINGWGAPVATGYNASPGSSLASDLVYADVLAHKTYYTRADGSLSSIYEYEDGRAATESVITPNPSATTVNLTAAIASADIPSWGNSSYCEGRVFRINNNDYPYEDFSRNGTSWVNQNSPIWGQADYGSQGGLAVTSWVDTDSNNKVTGWSTRLYYEHNGKVTEYGAGNDPTDPPEGTWTQWEVFN